MHGSLQFIIKASSVFERNSSSRSFIVSCCSLIWVLANVASSEVLSRYSTSILRYSLWSVSCYIHTFLLPPLLWLCLLWLYWGLWFIYSCSFWKLFSFLLFFFSISNNNFLLLFPDFGDFSVNSWSVPFPML